MRRQVQEAVLHRPTLRDRAAQTLEVELRTCIVQTELSDIDRELRIHQHSKARAVQVAPHTADRHVQVDTVATTSVGNTVPRMSPLSHGRMADSEGNNPSEGSGESELSEVEEEEEEMDTPTDGTDDTPTSNVVVMASGGTAVSGLAVSCRFALLVAGHAQLVVPGFEPKEHLFCM